MESKLNVFNWKYFVTIHFTPKYDVNNLDKEFDNKYIWDISNLWKLYSNTYYTNLYEKQIPKIASSLRLLAAS